MTALEIRSYRSVFELERRIYRVDQLRLNPAGVPVRGVIYFLGLLAMMLVLARVPVLGALVRILPWYVCDLALPLASAGLFTLMRVEGRPFHLAALALGRNALRPRRLVAFRSCRAPGGRWYPESLLILPDGSDSRLRRLSYTGPGSVLVTSAHERVEGGVGALAGLARRPRLTLHDLPGCDRPAQGQVIVLDPGVRLRVGR